MSDRLRFSLKLLSYTRIFFEKVRHRIVEQIHLFNHRTLSMNMSRVQFCGVYLYISV